MAITDMTLRELENTFVSIGEPKFRAKQVWKWVFKRLAVSFDEMTDLPAELRGRIADMLPVFSVSPVAVEVSRDRQTRKVLLKLGDGSSVEAVLMSYDPTEVTRRRRTVCVSTQVGCAFGCSFCATGVGGLLRNLSSGEIVEQVLYFERELRNKKAGGQNQGLIPGERGVSNVVFMGMGEPLANYAAVIKAIEILNDPDGYNLGSRHMTVSTVGIVPSIVKLSKENLQVGLAVSLHAPNQALRERLVPIAKRYPLAALMSACKEYISVTKRRVTFEYALAAGVNDSVENARELAGLLKGMLCHVNLIPVNRHEGAGFSPSPESKVKAFQVDLMRKGISTTIRVERGVDIQAACGQLRARTVAGPIG